MQFNYAYKGKSAVDNRHLDATQMSFAPDLKRDPTYFSGELKRASNSREAIGALHDVVVSDLRFHPKDKTEYKAWAAQQEQLNWQEVAGRRREVAERIRGLQTELEELTRRSASRMAPSIRRGGATSNTCTKDRDAWFVLDPVITVHPDEIFFECFSARMSRATAAWAQATRSSGHRRVRLRHHQHRLFGGALRRVSKVRPTRAPSSASIPPASMSRRAARPTSAR